MKAKFIRDKNPYKSMQIGKHRFTKEEKFIRILKDKLHFSEKPSFMDFSAHIQIIKESPEQYNITKSSKYYRVIHWAYNNIFKAYNEYEKLLDQDIKA